MTRSGQYFLAVLAATLPLAAQEAAPPPDDVVEKAIAIVEQHYRKPVAHQDLVASALKGLVSGLDPYCLYLDPGEWRALQESLHSEFAGIGVVLEIDSATLRPRVAQLTPGSYAPAAGIGEGDAILAVDGQPTQGLPIERVFPLMRGAAGTTVHLSVLHPGAQAPVEIAVVRRVIKVSSVRGVARDRAGRQRYLLDPGGRIGYARIDSMASDTAEGLAAALDELAGAGMRGLVLDLRDTPGGFMSAALDSADLFLDSGLLLTVESRADGKESRHAKPGTKTHAPLVLLINENTASAAEILAAALQDNHRAVLVGERTWGKGYVGELYSLGENQGGLRITVASFQRPSGQTLDRHEAPAGSPSVGVAPDPGMEIRLEPSEAEAWAASFYRPQLIVEGDAASPAPSGEDRALALALKVLRQRIAAPGGG